MLDFTQIRQALEAGEFVPYYQPIVRLHTGVLQGFEALARWERPNKRVVQPDQFIWIAERDGWIGELTSSLLGQAFTSASRFPFEFTLSINISPLQLRDLSLPRQISEAAERSAFPLRRLTVEVTESALLGDLENAGRIAGELKEMGCRLALDDFGTGYSSLLHLQALPFDELKVDRGFVSSMNERRKSRKIVAAVVGLGQSLGLTTVAEGIETQEQAEMLLWLGCELGQGWLYGRPTAGRELRSLIDAPRHKVTRADSTHWNGVSVNNLDAMPSQRLAHLQALYDGAPAGLGFLDRNLRYVNLNRKLADMNGAPVEEHLGNTVAEMVPALFPQVEPYLRRALEGEAVVDVEAKLPGTAATGVETRLLSYQPAKDETGEVLGISVAVIDITKRKHAEESQRDTQAFYNHLVELNPQTVWILGPDGRNLDVSPRWERVFESTDEHARGHGWLDAIHPDDVQSTVDIIASHMKSGLPIDVRYRTRHLDGTWHWMRSQGSPRVDEAGLIVCWYGSVEDMDELKLKEARLLKRQPAPDGVLAVVPRT